MHPYSSIDATAAWKNLRFILSVRSDFYMTDSRSLAVHAFASRVSMSVSVDETLLPWWSGRLSANAGLKNSQRSNNNNNNRDWSTINFWLVLKWFLVIFLFNHSYSGRQSAAVSKHCESEVKYKLRMGLELLSCWLDYIRVVLLVVHDTLFLCHFPFD